MTTRRLFDRLCTLLLLALVISPFTAPFRACDAGCGNDIRVELVGMFADADDAGAVIDAPRAGERGRLMLVLAPATGAVTAADISLAPVQLPLDRCASDHPASLRSTVLRL